MRETALIPGKDNEAEAAFDRDAMEAAGVDTFTLSVALPNMFGVLSGLLRDGCGVALVARPGGTVSLIGLTGVEARAKLDELETREDRA